MPAPLDLQGMTFGDLKVICLAPGNSRTPARTPRTWLCKCSCGQLIYCTANLLTRTTYPKTWCGNFRMHPEKKHVGGCANRGSKPKVSKQKCWTCKKACGGYDCPWAYKDPSGYDPKPVPGWEAIPTKVNVGMTSANPSDDSFEIHDCPLYIKG